MQGKDEITAPAVLDLSSEKMQKALRRIMLVLRSYGWEKSHYPKRGVAFARVEKAFKLMTNSFSGHERAFLARQLRENFAECKTIGWPESSQSPDIVRVGNATLKAIFSNIGFLEKYPEPGDVNHAQVESVVEKKVKSLTVLQRAYVLDQLANSFNHARDMLFSVGQKQGRVPTKAVEYDHRKEYF